MLEDGHRPGCRTSNVLATSTSTDFALSLPLPPHSTCRPPVVADTSVGHFIKGNLSDRRQVANSSSVRTKTSLVVGLHRYLTAPRHKPMDVPSCLA
ncbi:hypothetical protein PLICRDRAFT_35943 [Plicaturopsis crispa FD-325 SS-3]|nr:hypothetical protein PLICRDRAFT_35943 [Plicaturopsis crispa FD-325 SS-3]